jgi:hypothetical protein
MEKSKIQFYNPLSIAGYFYNRMLVYFTCMKKIPLTIIPVALLVIFIILFSRIPAGQDLISESGDTVAGFLMGVLLAVSLWTDWRRFKK